MKGEQSKKHVREAPLGLWMFLAIFDAQIFLSSLSCPASLILKFPQH